MNRYFVYSGVLHAAFFAAGMFFFNAVKTPPPPAVYTIDFLGQSFQSVGGAEAAAPQAPQPSAQPAPAPAKKEYAAKAEITTKPKPKLAAKKPAPKKITLSGPSVLSEPAAEAAASAPGQNALGINTDYSNFPYPYYIQQVRNSLWTEWQKRKPAGVMLSAFVTFTITKTGAAKDVKTAQKSGNDMYDYAAVAAITNAAPFAPLPDGFEKDILTVTVNFKDE